MPSFLTDYDLYLFGEGKHFRLYDKFGAHLGTQDGVEGTHFAVWAPNAREVCVVGDFNHWKHGAYYLSSRGASGVWDGFMPKVGAGALYKFSIQSQYNNFRAEKADPFGFAAEIRPLSASKVWDLSRYHWNDADWMATRKKANALDAAISIYEVHLGSWRRKPEEGNRWLTYREMAPLLADYVSQMGYTHVEFCRRRHPFDGSWGYQTVATMRDDRFGTPMIFAFSSYSIKRASAFCSTGSPHFPWRARTRLFRRHASLRTRIRGHRVGAFILTGRNESATTLSPTRFWLDQYHIDGMRRCVASMLYLVTLAAGSGFPIIWRP